MKTFKQFQEAAIAAPAIAGASKYIIPFLMTGIGAAGTILQARKKGKFQRKEMKGRVGENQKIKPKLLDAVRKKQREIEGNVNDKLNTPTDIVDFTGKNVDKKTLERMNKRVDQFNSYDPLQEEAPTNSIGGGNIAGSIEAGDEPPVNKRKKKGEPTIMARGLLPGARTRFKTGADLFTRIKKNKYS